MKGKENCPQCAGTGHAFGKVCQHTGGGVQVVRALDLTPLNAPQRASLTDARALAHLAESVTASGAISCCALPPLPTWITRRDKGELRPRSEVIEAMREYAELAVQGALRERDVQEVMDRVNGRRIIIADVIATLPGSYYMDPPDGGDVSVLEQLRRMAEDARRYRWLRNKATSFAQVGKFTPYVIKGQIMRPLDGGRLDAEVDAAEARK